MGIAQGTTQLLISDQGKGKYTTITYI